MSMLYRSLIPDGAASFLKEFESLGCSCCENVVGFGHRATGTLICSSTCPGEQRPRPIWRPLESDENEDVDTGDTLHAGVQQLDLEEQPDAKSSSIVVSVVEMTGSSDSTVIAAKEEVETVEVKPAPKFGLIKATRSLQEMKNGSLPNNPFYRNIPRAPKDPTGRK